MAYTLADARRDAAAERKTTPPKQEEIDAAVAAAMAKMDAPPTSPPSSPAPSASPVVAPSSGSRVQAQKAELKATALRNREVLREQAKARVQAERRDRLIAEYPNATYERKRVLLPILTGEYGITPTGQPAEGKMTLAPPTMTATQRKKATELRGTKAEAEQAGIAAGAKAEKANLGMLFTEAAANEWPLGFNSGGYKTDPRLVTPADAQAAQATSMLGAITFGFAGASGVSNALAPVVKGLLPVGTSAAAAHAAKFVPAMAAVQGSIETKKAIQRAQDPNLTEEERDLGNRRAFANMIGAVVGGAIPAMGPGANPGPRNAISLKLLAKAAARTPPPVVRNAAVRGVIGGAAQGGVEALAQTVAGLPFDPVSVAMQAGMGAVGGISPNEHPGITSRQGMNLRNAVRPTPAMMEGAPPLRGPMPRQVIAPEDIAALPEAAVRPDAAAPAAPEVAPAKGSIELPGGFRAEPGATHDAPWRFFTPEGKRVYYTEMPPEARKAAVAAQSNMFMHLNDKERLVPAVDAHLVTIPGTPEGIDLFVHRVETKDGPKWVVAVADTGQQRAEGATEQEAILNAWASEVRNPNSLAVDRDRVGRTIGWTPYFLKKGAGSSAPPTATPTSGDTRVVSPIQQQILNLLRQGGPQKLADIHQSLGKSREDVWPELMDLHSKGLIHHDPYNDLGMGQGVLALTPHAESSRASSATPDAASPAADSIPAPVRPPETRSPESAPDAPPAEPGAVEGGVGESTTVTPVPKPQRQQKPAEEPLPVGKVRQETQAAETTTEPAKKPWEQTRDQYNASRRGFEIVGPKSKSAQKTLELDLIDRFGSHGFDRVEAPQGTAPRYLIPETPEHVAWAQANPNVRMSTGPGSRRGLSGGPLWKDLVRAALERGDVTPERAAELGYTGEPRKVTVVRETYPDYNHMSASDLAEQIKYELHRQGVSANRMEQASYDAMVRATMARRGGPVLGKVEWTKLFNDSVAHNHGTVSRETVDYSPTHITRDRTGNAEGPMTAMVTHHPDGSVDFVTANGLEGSWRAKDIEVFNGMWEPIQKGATNEAKPEASVEGNLEGTRTADEGQGSKVAAAVDEIEKGGQVDYSGWTLEELQKLRRPLQVLLTNAQNNKDASIPHLRALSRARVKTVYPALVNLVKHIEGLEAQQRAQAPTVVETPEGAPTIRRNTAGRQAVESYQQLTPAQREALHRHMVGEGQPEYTRAALRASADQLSKNGDPSTWENGVLFERFADSLNDPTERVQWDTGPYTKELHARAQSDLEALEGALDLDRRNAEVSSRLFESAKKADEDLRAAGKATPAQLHDSFEKVRAAEAQRDSYRQTLEETQDNYDAAKKAADKIAANRSGQKPPAVDEAQGKGEVAPEPAGAGKAEGPHTVYRADLPATGNRQLTGVQDVGQVLGLKARAPDAPFEYFTFDKADAEHYASRDEAYLAQYEKAQPGKGLETFRILHGHEPRGKDTATLRTETIAPKKTLDLTELGPTVDGNDFMRIMAKAAGIADLPKDFSYRDVPPEVKAKIEAFLQKYGLNAGDDEPTWSLLRNNLDSIEATLIERGQRTLSGWGEQVRGNLMGQFLRDFGYDSITYMHEGGGKPIKHLVVLKPEMMNGDYVHEDVGNFGGKFVFKPADAEAPAAVSSKPLPPDVSTESKADYVTRAVAGGIERGKAEAAHKAAVDRAATLDEPLYKGWEQDYADLADPVATAERYSKDLEAEGDALRKELAGNLPEERTGQMGAGFVPPTSPGTPTGPSHPATAAAAAARFNKATLDRLKSANAPGAMAAAKESIANAARAVQHVFHYLLRPVTPHLDWKNPVDAKVLAGLVHYSTKVVPAANREAAELGASLRAGLTVEQSRLMDDAIIMRDFAKSPKDVVAPWFDTVADKEAAIKRVEADVAADPEVVRRLDQRDRLNQYLANRRMAEAKKFGITLDQLKDSEGYFSHDVLQYKDKDVRAAIAASTVRNQLGQGGLRQRTWSAFLYSSDVQRVDQQHFAEMLSRTEWDRTAHELFTTANRAPEMKAAQKAFLTWRETHPTGFDPAANLDVSVKNRITAWERMERARVVELKAKGVPDVKPRTVPLDMFRPDGVVPTQYVSGNRYFSGTVITKSVLDKVTDVVGDRVVLNAAKAMGLDPAKLTEALQRAIDNPSLIVGSKNEVYYLPENVAAAMRDLMPEALLRGNPVVNAWSKGVGVFKGVVTNVANVVFHGRNFLGDSFALLRFYPMGIRNLPRAWKELWHVLLDPVGKPPAPGSMLAQFQKMGGLDTSSLSAELQASGINIHGTGGIDALINYGNRLSTFRETTARYASFISAMEDQAKHGTITHFGAADPHLVRNLDYGADVARTRLERAYQVSNDSLGNYEHGSQAARLLRRTLAPFIQWKYINHSRELQALKNLWSGFFDKEMRAAWGNDANKRAAGQILWWIAGTALELNVMNLWNQQFPEFEKQIPLADQKRPHLVFPFKRSDGSVYYVTRLGNLPDLFDTWNINEAPGVVQMYWNGGHGFQKMVAELVKSTAQGAGNAALTLQDPFSKAAVEVAMQRQYGLTWGKNYPIRDWGDYAAGKVAIGPLRPLQEVFRLATGRPVEQRRGAPHEQLANYLFTEKHPNEAASRDVEDLLEEIVGNMKGENKDLYNAIGQSARARNMATLLTATKTLTENLGEREAVKRLTASIRGRNKLGLINDDNAAEFQKQAKAEGLDLAVKLPMALQYWVDTTEWMAASSDPVVSQAAKNALNWWNTRRSQVMQKALTNPTPKVRR